MCILYIDSDLTTLLLLVCTRKLYFHIQEVHTTNDLMNMVFHLLIKGYRESEHKTADESFDQCALPPAPYD